MTKTEKEKMTQYSLKVGGDLEDEIKELADRDNEGRVAPTMRQILRIGTGIKKEVPPSVLQRTQELADRLFQGNFGIAVKNALENSLEYQDVEK